MIDPNTGLTLIFPIYWRHSRPFPIVNLLQPAQLSICNILKVVVNKVFTMSDIPHHGCWASPLVSYTPGISDLILHAKWTHIYQKMLIIVLFTSHFKKISISYYSACLIFCKVVKQIWFNVVNCFQIPKFYFNRFE